MLLESEKLMQRSLLVAPGGVHSPVRAFKSVGGTPVFFARAEGAYLYSVEGDEYIDFCQSFGPLLLGHRDPDVSEAVRQMLDRAWSFGTCEPYSLELAEYISQKVPWAEKIRFVSSGTEAVMSALRVARAATGRNKILKFNGCYHGHVDSMLVKSGSGLAGIASSDSAGVSQTVASDTLVAELNDMESVKNIFAQHGSEIAAIIVEPLPANYGLLIQTKEFLQFLRKISFENQCLLIFDEVISGFRVAMGGMAELMQITPDLVTFGKVIGGGFPVGCYAGKKELMNLVAPLGPVYQAGTLSANPVGMAAGLATLKKIETRNVHCELEERTQKFINEMNQLFERHQAPFQASSYTSLFWIHGKVSEKIRSLKQIPAGHAENFKKLFHMALQKKIYLAPSAYEVGFLSLAHTDAILQETLHRLENILQEF